MTKQRELLREIARILRPDGVFILRDMVAVNSTSQLCNDMMHSIYGIFDNGLSPQQFFSQAETNYIRPSEFERWLDENRLPIQERIITDTRAMV